MSSSTVNPAISAILFTLHGSFFSDIPFSSFLSKYIPYPSRRPGIAKNFVKALVTNRFCLFSLAFIILSFIPSSKKSINASSINSFVLYLLHSFSISSVSSSFKNFPVGLLGLHIISKSYFFASSFFRLSIFSLKSSFSLSSKCSISIFCFPKLFSSYFFLLESPRILESSTLSVAFTALSYSPNVGDTINIFFGFITFINKNIISVAPLPNIILDMSTLFRWASFCLSSM